jgi:hypothetical protein
MITIPGNGRVWLATGHTDMPNLFALMSVGSDHPNIAADGGGGATRFGATMKGRTGGLGAKGSPERFGPLSLTG